MLVKAIVAVMIVVALVTWVLIDHTAGVFILLAAVVLFFSMKRRKQP